jgi:hypothetical protein
MIQYRYGSTDMMSVYNDNIYKVHTDDDKRSYSSTRIVHFC